MTTYLATRTHNPQTGRRQWAVVHLQSGEIHFAKHPGRDAALRLERQLNTGK
jgi:hypothetical protein